MNFERQDIGLGLFVLTAAAAVLIGLVGVAGILKHDTIDLHVIVESVPSVRRGSVVYVQGYRVGELNRISPVTYPKLAFMLTFEVDAEFPLYQGTTAAIGAQGFIGDAIIDLQLPERPGRRLADGDTIPEASIPDLSLVISRADTLAQAIQQVALRLADILSPQAAGSLIDELRATLVSTRETFSVLEDQFVDLADSLRYGMRAATGSLEQVSGILTENRERISGTLDSTQAMIAGLRDLAGSADALIDTTGPGLQRSLAELEQILAELKVLVGDMNRYTFWQMLFKNRHPDDPPEGHSDDPPGGGH